MSVRQRRIVGHRLIGCRQSLGAFAIRSEQRRLQQQCRGVLRLPFQHLVDSSERFGSVALDSVERREPHGRDPVSILPVRRLLQQLPRIVEPADDDVVLGEGELRADRVDVLCDGFEVWFGLVLTTRRHEEHAEGAVGLDTLRIDLERGVQHLLGVGGATTRPVEVRERQTRVNGLGGRVHRLLEGGFRLLPLSLHELNGPEVRVQLAAGRIARDGVFVFGDGAAQVLQSGERVAAEDLRVHVASLESECLVGTCARIFVRAGEQQQLACLDLRLGALGHQNPRRGCTRVRRHCRP
ncbi:MAG: hypothetical protein QM736_06690 [Vicinamibacterales bacterium]